MITYKDTKTFSAQELETLFNSVGWLSGKYPKQLVKAMQNSSTVFSAWDGTELAGLVNVLDDSVLTAYIHCLLVSPKYQNIGIGRTLVAKVKEKYKNYLYLLLMIDDPENRAFYEQYGFTVAESSTPMLIFSPDKVISM